jgi:tRNAThr (cytosine32-N3)-methyltransferase
MVAENDQTLPVLAAREYQDEVALQSRPEGLIALDPPTHVIDPLTAQTSPRFSECKDNLKRSNPFQFGSRYLQVTDDVYEFNAWDHVETDDAYKEYAEVQYAKQREAPVSDFDKSKCAISILLI